MRFRMQVKSEDRDEAWWEEYDTANHRLLEPGDSAEEAALSLVEFFNNTLRPNESPRQVLAVEELPDLPRKKSTQ